VFNSILVHFKVLSFTASCTDNKQDIFLSASSQVPSRPTVLQL